MENVLNQLSRIQEWNNISIIVRLSLAVLMGGLIGLERSQNKHTAGLRTFALICLGSALCTIANIYLQETTGSADTSRIAAGVVSGIGFIGVGTIIITGHNRVRGLTTAAGLWTAGCLGIALGAGMIWISVFCFILIMLVMNVLHPLSKSMEAHSRIIDIYIEIDMQKGIEELNQFVREHNFKVLSLVKKREKIMKGSNIVVYIQLDLKKRMDHSRITEEITKLTAVEYCEEV